jgi:hypothetical protein
MWSVRLRREASKASVARCDGRLLLVLFLLFSESGLLFENFEDGLKVLVVFAMDDGFGLKAYDFGPGVPSFGADLG